MLALFRRRVFLNPMGTKLYLSIAHDKNSIDELMKRFGSALDEISL
jgi:glutamate-1-semialdehyde 2,1-aminomutase